MSVSSLWRAWCLGHGMGEAGQGAFAGFMVSNRSPSSPIRFSLLSTKMSAVDCFFFRRRLKTEWYFWDQQVLLIVTASLPNITAELTLSEVQDGKVNFVFLTGSTRVTRRTRVTRGQGPSRRGQSGTNGMSNDASPCYIFIFLQCFYVHIFKCKMWLYFIGASRKEWGTWTCGNYCLKIDIKFMNIKMSPSNSSSSLPGLEGSTRSCWSSGPSRT